MKRKGKKLVPGKVEEWLDCGNKEVTVNTNKRYLEFIKNKDLVASTAKIENSVSIAPSYIGENVVIRNSVVGPHVSLGDNSTVTDSRIENAIIQTNTTLREAVLKNSMVGNFVSYEGKARDFSIGDFTVIKD